MYDYEASFTHPYLFNLHENSTHIYGDMYKGLFLKNRNSFQSVLFITCKVFNMMQCHFQKTRQTSVERTHLQPLPPLFPLYTVLYYEIIKKRYVY
jgi:hypothetical protein